MKTFTEIGEVISHSESVCPVELLENIPTEEIPTEEIPTEEIPAEEIPTEEIPTEEIPTEEIPTVTAPIADAPEDEEIPLLNNNVKNKKKWN